MSKVLIDTSVLVSVFRDKTQNNAERLVLAIGDDDVVMTELIAGELLAGSKDDAEWSRIEQFVQSKAMLPLVDGEWVMAARLYFDARRGGKTIRKLSDCHIANAAILNDATLLHNDRDFEAIAKIRPLKHIRLDLAKA